MGGFSINVEINPLDLFGLKENGYKLYVFKAVKTSCEGAACVGSVFGPEFLLTQTQINCEEEVHAYISDDVVEENKVIYPRQRISLKSGNSIQIDSSGHFQATQTGRGHGIHVQSKTNASYTIGLAQKIWTIEKNVAPSILFATSLTGVGKSCTMTTTDKVLLIFSTENYDSGTPLHKTISTGAFIDMSGFAHRAVSFNLENGWQAHGADWLKVIPAFRNLKDLLLEHA